MTTDAFTTAARAEAEPMVEDIIRWDDTVATDGPCDGTWDSLAEYLIGYGWTRDHLAAQEATDAEIEAATQRLQEEFNICGDARGCMCEDGKERAMQMVDEVLSALTAAKEARHG